MPYVCVCVCMCVCVVCVCVVCVCVVCCVVLCCVMLCGYVCVCVCVCVFMCVCSYESLLVEERQTNQEVMAFQRRMDVWPTSSNAEHTTAANTGIGDRGRGSDTALPPAVVALEVHVNACLVDGQDLQIQSQSLCLHGRRNQFGYDQTNISVIGM